MKVMCAMLMVSDAAPGGPADRLLHRDEQQQQRQAGDDLGHHQRRGDHAGEQRAAAERRKRTSAMPRERAEDQAPVALSARDAKRQPGGAEDLVVRANSSPYHLRREAAPDRDQPRLVEREDDQRQDRRVEEHEAERSACVSRNQDGRVLIAAASAPRRAWKRWNSMIGTTSSSSMAIATAEATGQSRLVKNSSHSTRPIIS